MFQLTLHAPFPQCSAVLVVVAVENVKKKTTSTTGCLTRNVFSSYCNSKLTPFSQSSIPKALTSPPSHCSQWVNSLFMDHTWCFPISVVIPQTPLPPPSFPLALLSLWLLLALCGDYDRTSLLVL